MLADELQRVLTQLSDSVRQRVSLECLCENLETVYVHLDEQDGIRIDDDHQTFQYLDRSQDVTYVPLEALDLDATRSAAREFDVDLVAAPPEGYPSLRCRLSAERRVADAVDRVSRAIDAVFQLALRPDLK